MRKNTNESPEMPAAKPAEVPKAPKAKGTGRNWRPLALMGAILFLAAFVRVVFAFSVSADSGFALSGGTDASNNLRFIESIVADHKVRFTDNWLNYPDGTLIVVPVLFDAVMSVFALLVNLVMDDPVQSSSAVLAFSGPVFGVLACIPMYFVGKEMFSSKIAGYASAGFLALCPVFVEESAFSNGTGMSFALFFFLIGIYYLVKALKGLNNNVSAYKTSIIAGIFIAIAMSSWIDFRQVAIPLVIVMVAQSIIDRFKNRDPRPAATVYAMVLAIGFVLPCVGYTVAGYFDALVSGTMFFIVLAIGFAMAYSWTYKKSWVLTFPVCAGVCLLILLVLSIVTPQFYDYVLYGNSPLDPALVAMMGKQSLTLSQLTSFYGVVTYWFVFLVCLYMLFRVLKNAHSPIYIFTMVWLFVMTLTLGHDSLQAAFAAPVFALGFGVVIKVALERINFKAYFAGIKTGAGAKTKIRRIISPAPLLAILVAVLLVAGPNMMQVIDAGIPSNESEKYNDQIRDVVGNDQFGTLSFYIKTDDSWTVKDALKSIDGQRGAVVTWMSFSDDVKIYANMKSFTDMYGNGTAAASNILLANGVNGSSAAALLLTAVMSKGTGDDTKNALTESGFSAEDVQTIFDVLDDVDKVVKDDKSAKDLVLEDYGTYGAVESNISDKNVQYLYLTDFIASNYHSTTINKAYDKLGLRTPYIMVTGDMMPFFVGYANVFDQMAMLNDYSVDLSYGTVSKFMTYGYNAYINGIYDLTQNAFDSMLYRTYIGMSPSEAGYSTISEYLNALSSADASVQMHPGYGLSNYDVAYWHVMYNKSNNATSSSDGWEEMDAAEAIALQKTSGGRINYISGLPIILRYVSSSTGEVVSGTVMDSGAQPMKDVRVVAVDEDGVVHSTTHTSEDGTFELFVADKAKTTLVYYAGAGYASSGGVIIGAQSASDATIGLDGVVKEVTGTIQIDLGGAMQSVSEGGVLLYDIKIENPAVSTEVQSFTKGDAVTDFTIGIGKQTITVSDGDSTVATFTFSVKEGMTSFVLPASVHDYTLTIKDIYGAPIAGTNATLDGAKDYTVVSDDNGECKFTDIIDGDYKISVPGYYVSSPSVTISSTTSKELTLAPAKDVTVTVPAAGVTLFVYGDAFSASAVTDAANYSITLPYSEVSETKYTAYCLYNGKIWVGVIGMDTPTVALAENELATVTGTLKGTDDAGVSGTIYFYNADGAKFKVTANSEKGYKAYLPAGSMFVYASDSSNGYFGEIDLAAGANTEKDFKLAEADRVTFSTVTWGVTHQYVMSKLTVNGHDLPIMSTNSSTNVYLPRETAANAEVLIDAGLGFNAITRDIAADHSASVTVSGTLTFTTTPEISVTNTGALSGLAGDTKLSIGGVSKTITQWTDGEKFTLANSKSVILGESDDAVYYSTSHKFRPDAATTIDIAALLGVTSVNDVTFNMITVTGYTSDYTAYVYYGDGESVSVYSESAKQVQSKADVEVGDMYTVYIYNKEKTLVYIETYAAGDKTVNVEDCVTASSVKGYIGADVNTDIVFTEGDNVLKVKATNGSYSTVLKRDVAYTASVSDVVSGSTYVLPDTVVTFADATETRNFFATTTVNAFNANVTLTSEGTMTKVVFNIEMDAITNTGDSAETFKITAGPGWDSFYVLAGGENVGGMVLDAGGTSPLMTFTGYYNSAMYRLGTSDLSLKIEGTDDTASAKFVGIGGEPGLVFINKDADVVSDHTYTYNYSIVNMGSSVADITVDTGGITLPDGWSLYYSTSDYLGTSTTTGAPTSVMPGTTKISVVLMPQADGSEVPAGTVTFAAADMATATPDDITIEGGTATSSVSAEAAEVSVTDMSASGRGVVNDQGKMPTIVWVMIAAMVLLIILIFWMSSKRGVFSRRK